MQSLEASVRAMSENLSIVVPNGFFDFRSECWKFVGPAPRFRHREFSTNIPLVNELIEPEVPENIMFRFECRRAELLRFEEFGERQERGGQVR